MRWRFFLYKQKKPFPGNADSRRRLFGKAIFLWTLPGGSSIRHGMVLNYSTKVREMITSRINNTRIAPVDVHAPPPKPPQ
jgi:hypothetical protein